MISFIFNNWAQFSDVVAYRNSLNCAVLTGLVFTSYIGHFFA